MNSISQYSNDSGCLLTGEAAENNMENDILWREVTSIKKQ